MAPPKRRYDAVVALDFGSALSKGVVGCHEQILNKDCTWRCGKIYQPVEIQWPGQEEAFDMACCGTKRSSIANNNNVVPTRLFGQQARMQCQTKGLSSLIYGLKLTAYDVHDMQGTINNMDLDQMTVKGPDTSRASIAQRDDTSAKKAKIEPSRLEPYPSMIDLVNRSMEAVRSVNDALGFSRDKNPFGLITEAIKEMRSPILTAVLEACQAAGLRDIGHKTINVKLVLTVPEKLKDNVQYFQAIESGFKYVFPDHNITPMMLDEAHADLIGLTQVGSDAPPLAGSKIRMLLNMGGGLCTLTSVDVASTKPVSLVEFESPSSVLSGGELVLAQFDAAIWNKHLRPRLVADGKPHKTCQRDLLQKFRLYLQEHATSNTAVLPPFSFKHPQLASFFPMVIPGYGMTQEQIDGLRKAMRDGGVQVYNGYLTVQPEAVKKILDSCIDPLCDELINYLKKVKAKIVSKFGSKADMTDWVDYLIVTGGWRGYHLEERIRQAVRDSNCLENDKIYFVVNYRKDNIARGAFKACTLPNILSVTSNKLSVGVVRPIDATGLKHPVDAGGVEHLNKCVSAKDVGDSTRWVILKGNRGSEEFVCRATHQLSKVDLEQAKIDIVENIVWSPCRLESSELGLAELENYCDRSVRFVDHSMGLHSVYTVGQVNFAIVLKDDTAETAAATAGYPVFEYESCFMLISGTLYHSFKFKSGGHMDCAEWNCTRQCESFQSPWTNFSILRDFSRTNATQTRATSDIRPVKVADITDDHHNDSKRSKPAKQAKQAKPLKTFNFSNLAFRPR